MLAAVRVLLLRAKALADPTRVRIVAALRGRELCVCELCDALAATQSTLSTHLQLLRKAGVTASRKEGKWNYHSLAPGSVGWVEQQFAAFAASLGADRRLAADAKRLKARLALRSDGACCVGFGCCPPKRRKGSR